MSKQQDDEQGRALELATISTVVEAEAESANDTPAEEPPPYRTWHGMRVYDCPNCKFDCLYENELQDHVKAHLLPPGEASRAVVLTDRYGNEYKE